ncbi:septum formation initiator family protein [Desulfobaculum senezii]|uniref:FtsB family cell division protein n=1 Tax=Desulfobaculum sp. SPO524 TaxID=3378071 RepID=UPI00385443FF
MRRIFLVILILLNLTLGYRLLVGDQGLIAYRELREDHEQMTRRLAEAEQRARDLSREIRLLKSDRDYLKDTLRKRMNYLERDEIVYVFPDSQSDTPDTHPGAAIDADQD